MLVVQHISTFQPVYLKHILSVGGYVKNFHILTVIYDDVCCAYLRPVEWTQLHSVMVLSLLARLFNRQDVVFRGFGRRSA